MNNNGFWIKILNVVLIVGAILFYNQAAFYHKNAEAANKQLKEYAEQIKAAAPQNGTSADGKQQEASSLYNDGTYEGSARGYGGNINVKVTVEQDTITDINVTSAANETPSYYNSAVAVIDSILTEQSVDVDGVSGATYSSNGIKNAVKAALDKAKK